ncbi:MAG TPA: hypothetical protein VFI27_07020 [candidate division Zixibacteria bacterium]|nr:hypothetical protein [candidate division Zixibacteria bacterium]
MGEDELLGRGDPQPGFKWPVEVAHPIAAPAEKVWEVISMPGNLEPCHPFCAKNPVKKWPGEGAKDEIHYLSGWVLERSFYRWFDGVGYDLEIGRSDGRKSFVSWRVMPADDQSCVLKIAIYPYALQNIPTVIRWLPYLAYISPRLRSYLTSVVKGFEWYVIRGEPVPRNQFGTHPWFSPTRSAQEQ